MFGPVEVAARAVAEVDCNRRAAAQVDLGGDERRDFLPGRCRLAGKQRLQPVGQAHRRAARARLCASARSAAVRPRLRAAWSQSRAVRADAPQAIPSRSWLESSRSAM